MGRQVERNESVEKRICETYEAVIVLRPRWMVSSKPTTIARTIKTNPQSNMVMLVLTARRFVEKRGFMCDLVHGKTSSARSRG